MHLFGKRYNFSVNNPSQYTDIIDRSLQKETQPANKYRIMGPNRKTTCISEMRQQSANATLLPADDSNIESDLITGKRKAWQELGNLAWRASDVSTAFIREDQTFWVFWADLEKPSLNCWAAEDMLWRQLNIRAVLGRRDLCNFAFVRQMRF
ncbi:hypothetical protein TNCV_1488391 [Trichonephila clavipes]|nr:hypothetical protein TNCV_1488391 [Trichonephila clavipes]